MTLDSFLALQSRRKDGVLELNERESASFRARGYHISWYSTCKLEDLPSGAKRVSFKRIPACLRAGFQPGDIVKAWRYSTGWGRLAMYYFQDRDGDLQVAQ